MTLVGNCFVTSKNVFLQTGKDRLFVRDCYEPLFAEGLRQFEENKIQTAFIVGTPGVGKSCFLDYLLVKYTSKGSTVLYLSGPRNEAYLFRDGQVFVSDLEKLTVNLRELEHRSIDFDVVLFDPHETPAATNILHKDHLYGKPAFVSISPDKHNCQKLRKDLQTEGLYVDLYMGTVPLNEAQKMREQCFPQASSRAVEERYKVLGGIARYLYAWDKGGLNVIPAKIVQRQAVALNDIVANPLRIDLKEVPTEFKELWSLYHLEPVLENGVIKWDKCTVELCCHDAKARVRDKLLERTVQQCWKTYTSTDPIHGTLRGIRYEAYAHKKIMTAGLSGTALSLTKNGIGCSTVTVDIPAGLDHVIVPSNTIDKRLSEIITDTKEGYLLPERTNFPVVDSMAVGGKVGKKAGVVNLQMKAGRSDDLSKSCAKSIMEATKQDALIFIAPNENIMLKALKGAPPKMKQFVLIVCEKGGQSTKKRKGGAAPPGRKRPRRCKN